MPHVDELLLDSEVIVVLGIENYFDGEKNLKLFTLALPWSNTITVSSGPNLGTCWRILFEGQPSLGQDSL